MYFYTSYEPFPAFATLSPVIGYGDQHQVKQIAVFVGTYCSIIGYPQSDQRSSG